MTITFVRSSAEVLHELRLTAALHGGDLAVLAAILVGVASDDTAARSSLRWAIGVHADGKADTIRGLIDAADCVTSDAALMPDQITAWRDRAS